MKLTLREKQSFYHELEQFMRSGIPMPQAVEALLPESPRGGVRNALRRLQEYFRDLETVPNAFGRLRPDIGEMEVTLIASSSDSGRLDLALGYLSEYFGSLHEVRAGLLKQLAWPVVQLHLGVFLLSLPPLIIGTMSGFGYLLHCGSVLALVYALAIGGYLLGAALLRLARANAGVDRALSLIPVVGKLRRNFALSRFCATYEIQLQAGINVVNSLTAAARASQSARLIADADRAVPEILAGKQVAAALGEASSLPAAFRRVLRIGEETGSLDQDLRQWADYYQKASISSLQTACGWLQRIIYLFIALYLGYSIIATAQRDVFAPMDAMLK